MSDVVAGLDPRSPRGRVLGRRDDLHRAILDRNGKAKAAIIAIGRCLQLVEIGRLDIRGVRVERREHAIDRALDQGVVVDLVDIIGLHPLIDAHEFFELLVIGRVRRSEGAGGHGNQGERSDERERGEELADRFHTGRVLLRRQTLHLRAFSRLCPYLTDFEMNLR